MSAERIYQAALQQDESTLQKILSRNVIDETFPADDGAFAGMTAAERLASEGEHTAVEFLREKGAKVDDIAYGYAVSGYCYHAGWYCRNFEFESQKVEAILAKDEKLRREDSKEESASTSSFKKVREGIDMLTIGPSQHDGSVSTKLYLLKGRRVEEKDIPENTVYMFPGMTSHHADGSTLYSRKKGGG